ncbi:MAG: DUF4139 domain-containing protein [bacterium]
MLWIILAAATVASQVDSVVVYPNQVLVVRRAQVTVSGTGELVFAGLPGAIDDNTVRIRAEGLRIGEVQVKRGYLAEPTPEVRRLELRVQELEDALKGLDDEAAVLKAKEEFLGSVKLGSPELIARELQQGKVAPDAWRSALAFLGDELVRVKARGVKLVRERAEVDRLLAAARQEYSSARSAVEDRKEVRFECAGSGAFAVRLSYVIPNAASWSPYYELRANPAEGRVGVGYFARLAQRTGEDWDRVKVVLSTMQPSAGNTPPEPAPWYVSLYEAARSRRSGLMAAGMTDRVMMAPGYAKAEVEEAMPEVVETGIALQYVIPGRVSLKSGEQPKKLALHESSLPAEFEYLVAPRQREAAFLAGKLFNSSEFVFLAGQGNTYVGDEFTGSAWVPNVAPQESAQVAFGTDERIKVKRELVKSYKTRSGLFAKTEKTRFVYKTTVENFLPGAAKVKLVEAVPVSQDERVKVSVDKVEPKPLEEDKDRGLYTWRPEIAPRGKFTVDIEFEVEHPAGQPVGGLF